MAPGAVLNEVQPSRFLDLPTEIRLAIYELIIAEDNQEDELRRNKSVGRSPARPSITRVCRTTRKEAMDVWVPKVRFPLQFRATPWHESSVNSSGTHEYVVVQKSQHLPYSDLRKLELCFTETYGMNPLYYLYSVHLDERSNSYQVEHTPRTTEWWVAYRPWDIGAHKKAERRAAYLRGCFDRAVAEMIVSSGGVKYLTAQSYEHLTPRPEWRFGADLPDDDTL